MPLHNYICEDNHVEKDVYFSSNNGGAKKVRECPECGKESRIHFGSFGDYNRLMSTQGHDQLMPDPQTGMFYENATDKKVKIKALGLEEGDRKTASQIAAETYDAQAESKRKQADTPQAIKADSIDEIMRQINWDQVDRGQTGDLSRDVDDGYTF